jgi:hypothetical protein
MFFNKEDDIYGTPGAQKLHSQVDDDSFMKALIVFILILALMIALVIPRQEKVSHKLAYHVGDFVEEDVSALNVQDQYFLTPTPPVTRRTTPRV